MDNKRLLQILDRIVRSGSSGEAKFTGCSADEIEALEQRYSVKLPASYRAFLSVMGHGSGRMLTCDHVAVFYPSVLTLTDEFVRQRMGTGEVFDAPADFKLPPDALIISARLDAWWWFIRCNGEGDSPVWDFDEMTWTIKLCRESVFDWLEDWCYSY